VKLLGVCTRNEPVYTVMEYMLYGDLKTYLLARRHLVNERNREELDEVSNRSAILVFKPEITINIVHIDKLCMASTYVIL
jgi:Protein tyrosine and serine/threonine kinase